MRQILLLLQLLPTIRFSWSSWNRVTRTGLTTKLVDSVFCAKWGSQAKTCHHPNKRTVSWILEESVENNNEKTIANGNREGYGRTRNIFNYRTVQLTLNDIHWHTHNDNTFPCVKNPKTRHVSPPNRVQSILHYTKRSKEKPKRQPPQLPLQL